MYIFLIEVFPFFFFFFFAYIESMHTLSFYMHKQNVHTHQFKIIFYYSYYVNTQF